jgi:hypothetical protein
MKKYLCLVAMVFVCLCTSFSHAKTVTHHSAVILKSAPHVSTKLSIVSPQLHQPASIHFVGISSMNLAQPTVIAKALQPRYGKLAMTMISGKPAAISKLCYSTTCIAMTMTTPDAKHQPGCATQCTNFPYTNVSPSVSYNTIV